MDILKTIEQPAPILNAIYEFASKPQGMLLFSGKNGTGKTYVAECLYSILSPYKWPAYDPDIAIMVSQSELNAKWHGSMAKYGTTHHLMDKYANAKFLILDDIGTRTPTDSFMDFLYFIADKRYALRKTHGTMITTNLNSKDMREMFGDAFVSRMASGKCFRLEGEDRRMKEF